ncbi:MAG: hypothetical protein WA130_07320 [Candidatus Methanoperedens sp.]
MELINTSKVSTDNKITLIKEVADMLHIKKGDTVGFFKDDKGNIELKRVTIKAD